ncbi:hypothetical protein GCM10023237_08570 [Streptomyces coeruleoprunus]
MGAAAAPEWKRPQQAPYAAGSPQGQGPSGRTAGADGAAGFGERDVRRDMGIILPGAGGWRVSANVRMVPRVASRCCATAPILLRRT